MKSIAIVLGGKSPEHEVSIISARNIFNAIDANLFKIEVIGVSKSGEWFHLINNELFNENIQIGVGVNHIGLCLYPFDKQPVRYKSNQNPIDIDCFLPIIHGVYGEDGTLQGVFEYLNKPFVGPGVLASSIGMDKDVTKSILSHCGIKVVPWFTYFKNDVIDYDKLVEMGFPLFVKPANMGSGVGVEKANNIQELKKAIDLAFEYDIKILIEKGISGREVESAVMGNLNPEVTGIGEIIIQNGFYTYENKYVNNLAQVVIPAQNFKPSSVDLLKETALKAYRILQMEGLCRVDFFYISDQEFYLNEVNTLPGFTNISMYPKLWENEGLEYNKLITKLIEFAFERFDLRKEIRRER